MLDSLIQQDQSEGSSTADLESKLATSAGGLKDMLTGAAPGGAAGASPDLAAQVQLDPETIATVSDKLVKAGMLKAPVTTVTPEFISAVEEFAAQDSAGLYDFSKPDDIRRAAMDVADGNAGGGERNLGSFGGSSEPDAADEWIPGTGGGKQPT